jgi:hypothetical protein
MTSIRKVALACMTAAAVTMAVSAGAQTGPRNQDTFFTFSQPVELPTKTLPAGTYFFQLMDSDSNRHIVKFMSQDRKELFATLMAIPFYTNDRPSDEPQVRFMETAASASSSNSGSAAAGTNAIKIWFYPGNSVGHEFIYPRAQAMQIASRSGQSVLTTKSEAEVSAESELSRVNGSGIDSAVDMEASNQSAASTASTQTAGAQPTTEQTTTASATTEQSTAQREPVGAITGSQPAPERAEAQTPAPATTSAPATDRTAQTTPARADRTDLPRTAGALPLLALMGLGSLAGSRLMRRARR